MGGNLALLAPEGFEFKDEGTPSYSSKPVASYDIFDLFVGWDSIKLTYGNRVIIYEFEFNGGTAVLGDTIILSDLQVRATASAMPGSNGEITRIAISNDEVINGIATGTTSFGTLSTPQAPTSISQHITVKKEITVYPNPFTNSITISSEGKSFSNAELHVFDVLGNRVLMVENITGPGITLNSMTLTNGVYFYTIIDNDEHMKTGKIIKE